MRPITRETIVDRRQPQLRWSPILGGAVLAFALWILLQMLGMGIGLASVDTDDAGSLRGAGIGAGIWSIIAPLIAMFLGGLLAGRLSGTIDRKIGAMHATVMWALAVAFGLLLMVSVVSRVAGGVARVGGATMNATSSAIAAGAGNSGDVLSALGIGPNDLLGPINQRLQRDGKPTITADQMQATMRAIAQRGLRGGRLDREIVVAELARNTALSAADADDIARDLERRYQDAAARIGGIGQDAKEAALEAADKTGKALVIASVMMLLSLIAAAGGGMLGVHLANRRRTVAPIEPVVPPPPSPEAAI